MLSMSKDDTVALISSLASDNSSATAATAATSSAAANETENALKLRPSLPTDGREWDVTDAVLAAKSGRVERQRDMQMCRHGDTQHCIHCTPLEPYDPQVLASYSPPLKFMSFHTHLRKLNSGADRGRYTRLEQPQCALIPGCSNHPPYPQGICSRCQPGAMYLNRQKFRQVDYVQFESDKILDEFINFWRVSGNQRAGFLIGRYEEYEQVPLGVQAVVSAIYEPPQSNSTNGFEIKPDAQFATVQQVAGALGLAVVGWIFTDLYARSGIVQCTRFISDHRSALISAEELLNAAAFQNLFGSPVPKQYAPSGFFGSKFVTVVVSGGQDNMIVTKGYQCSLQGMGLQSAGCLQPAANAAGLMLVKTSTDVQYVPDVFYIAQDKYGNETTKAAKPSFPVEYLVVGFECGYKTASGTASATQPFPIEHRSMIAENQDLSALKRHMTGRNMLQEV
jgi:nuclear protein localization family protein 4